MIPWIKLGKVTFFVVAGGLIGYFLLNPFLKVLNLDSLAASNIGVNAGVIVGGFLGYHF